MVRLGVVRARLITRSEEGDFEDPAQSFTLREGVVNPLLSLSAPASHAEN